MAYDSTTGIISAPVDMGDIADALGVDSLDLETLCTAENVNKDSLIRPYESDRPDMTTDEIAAGGDDGFFGYNIPMTENGNVIDLWMKTWANRPPETYFHMLMFEGYCHAASYDDYPFRMKIQKVGSAWVVEYECHNDILHQVNPAFMSELATYYPAFQIFEQGTPSTVPASSPVFSWCGSQQIGVGRSGEYLYDMNLEDDKTYYVIPFLSQYKFTSFTGVSSIVGKKYCLIYKDWNISDWSISQGSVDIERYDAWMNLENQSSYTILATFGYRFYVEGLYIVPTYRTAVFNTNGIVVATDSNWHNVTSGFYAEIGTTYEFQVSISKVNAATGVAWPSGYTIRVYHKEQTGADGTNKEYYQDYIIP